MRVAVIGAGIVGAAIAARLASVHRVCLLEAEPRPGSHASGRSASMFALAYGDHVTRRLAAASQACLFDPDRAGGTLVSPCGMLHVASPGQEERLRGFAAETGLPVMAAGEVLAKVPILRRDKVIGGVLDEAAAAIDDHRYLQSCLAILRSSGGELRCNAGIARIERGGGVFRLVGEAEVVEADIVVNAAGAWADRVAALAGVRSLGLRALRRTAVAIDPPDGRDASGWPMAIDLDERWYFKPEGGRLLLSPADETPVEPHDVQPEEWDVAVAVDRYASLTGHEPKRVRHRWAGLRTFAEDRAPVIGSDPDEPSFVWAAGQGGAGFMTAPATAEIVAALIDRRSPRGGLTEILPALSPARLHS